MIKGQVAFSWVIRVLLVSLLVLATPVQVGTIAGMANIDSNVSVQVSAKAAGFLLNHTYDATLGLCSEVPLNRPNSLNFSGQVFWICSDNLLAYWALQNYNKTVSDTIKTSIMAYAVNYSLPKDSRGMPISYKHEPILGDTLPNVIPSNNYTRRDLVQDGSYLVTTEISNESSWENWRSRADECAWMGMSFLNKGDSSNAVTCYQDMMNMWDGCGFADAVYYDKHEYQSYKLALAIVLRQRLCLSKPPQENTMEYILAVCQGADGGVATDYSRSLSIVGHEENTETAALVVIADVSLPKHEEMKVGLYYYAWYGENLGGRHWNDSDVAPVVDRPVLGYYSSQNTSIAKQHLDWFKELNISFLIISWWGPESYEDDSAKIIFSMVKQNNYPIEIAIMVEAYNWSGIYDFNSICAYINDTYVVPYGSIYMRLDGLPLVCFFNDNINMTRTKDNRTAIRSVPGFSARIVGHTEPYVDWWAWPIAGYEETPQPRLSRDGFVGILPSYDDTRLPNNTNTTYDIKYADDLYHKQWEEVLELDKEIGVRFVGIYSWNEYHERSAVEPHLDPEGKIILLPFAETYHYTQTIPEFTPSAILPVFMILAVLATIVYRRKQRT